jgi:hypothetical protein
MLVSLIVNIQNTDCIFYNVVSVLQVEYERFDIRIRSVGASRCVDTIMK